MKKMGFFATVFAHVLMIGMPAQAAVNMYLKIDGIAGESVSKGHEGWIEVDSFAWEMMHSGSFDGGGGGAGKASFQDLQVTGFLSRVSPELYLTTAKGQVLTEVVLELQKVGVQPHVFFRIRLKNVLISSMSLGGGTGDDRTRETISFRYAEIEWTYIPLDETGSPGPPITTGWNVVENVSK